MEQFRAAHQPEIGQLLIIVCQPASEIASAVDEVSVVDQEDKGSWLDAERLRTTTRRKCPE
jgi:hypothetical protein